MKHFILNQKALRILALGVICATLFSFSSRPGGEGFEIYLNNKLLVQKFGSNINSVETVQLDPQYADAQLTVKYHHCGRVGKNRSITIKNEQNKVLKQWHFSDGDGASAMNCNVKDILSLGKGNNILNLYYSSTELPSGRLLTSIVTGSSTVRRNAR